MASPGWRRLLQRRQQWWFYWQQWWVDEYQCWQWQSQGQSFWRQFPIGFQEQQYCTDKDGMGFCDLSGDMVFACLLPDGLLQSELTHSCLPSLKYKVARIVILIIDKYISTELESCQPWLWYQQGISGCAFLFMQWFVRCLVVVLDAKKWNTLSYICSVQLWSIS